MNDLRIIRKGVCVFVAIAGCLAFSAIEVSGQSMGFKQLDQLEENPAGSKIVELLNQINADTECQKR